MRNGNPDRNNISPAYRRRRTTVVLLTITLVLLGSVQGMLMLFAAKDRNRIAQIRELSKAIAEERRESEVNFKRAEESEDILRIHQSAPAREPVATEGLALDTQSEPSLEGEAVGSPRAGLNHLVDLANFMAKERRASLVEWRGRLAILYEKVDPAANDPFWEIINVLSDLKLLDGVTVVTAESDAVKAGELRQALIDFGIAPERLKIGRKAEQGEVFTGVLISTNSGA